MRQWPIIEEMIRMPGRRLSWCHASWSDDSVSAGISVNVWAPAGEMRSYLRDTNEVRNYGYHKYESIFCWAWSTCDNVVD